MARLFRWIADAPRFVEINSKGQRTGRFVEGNRARELQYKLNTGKQLPRGWIRDWRHENGSPTNIFGRRTAFTGGSTPRIRSVSRQDIIDAKPLFDTVLNGIVKWHPIEQDYVWSSHVWSWMEWVSDADAEVVFYACYGEFADVTDLAVRDDHDPRSFLAIA